MDCQRVLLDRSLRSHRPPLLAQVLLYGPADFLVGVTAVDGIRSVPFVDGIKEEAA